MGNPYKIDLHTHSEASDGELTIKNYRHLLESKKLDYIAITDHNKIDYALKTKEKLKNHGLGDRIIVGEEITTKQGEIIGLYLSKKVKEKRPLEETIQEIKAQNGLLYIPHPFDFLRFGLRKKNLEKIISHVDIIEIFNPKNYIPYKNRKVAEFAEKYDKPGAASSDCHSLDDIVRTYTIIKDKPTRENLPSLLREAGYIKKYTKVSSFIKQAIHFFIHPEKYS